jgi:hypothetical protein
LVPLGYHTISLAWHFKVEIVSLNLATYEEVFVTKPPHVRKLLQQRGTEEGRNKYGENVWCQHTLTWMQLLHDTWSISKFVIPDVRFPNEVQFIRQHGGKVYRIIAPHRELSNSLTPEARAHSSETSLDNYHEFDGYISNDPKFESTVRGQIYRFMNIQEGLRA